MGNPTRKSLKHRISFGLFFLLLSIVIISCTDNEGHYHIYEVKDAKWAQNDTVIFAIDSMAFEIDSASFRYDSPLLETNTPYSLSIEVTNNVNYPYRNIWFFIQSNLESDTIQTELSKEYQIADIEGKWLGSGFGNLFQSSFLVADNILFREKRNYYIKLEHGMRDETLVGIEKVGFKLSKKQQ